MITQCGHCNVDSGGNHEWWCPCSPKTYPGPQVDDVVAALGLRLDALDAQLAAVTAERDALQAKVASQVEELNRIIRQKWEVEQERDGIKARSLAVIKARDYDLLMMRDAYSVAMSRIADMEQERDTLRTALRQVAEAVQRIKRFRLRSLDSTCPDCYGKCDHGASVDTIIIESDKALALPVVQEILKSP